MKALSSGSIPISIPIVLLGTAISAVLLRYFLQYWSLRHIPGPFAAKFTNFWLARKYWNKESFINIGLHLHEKYGPVVRYGPDRVIFSDLSAVPIIFSTKNTLRKV